MLKTLSKENKIAEDSAQDYLDFAFKSETYRKFVFDNVKSSSPDARERLKFLSLLTDRIIKNDKEEKQIEHAPSAPVIKPRRLF